MVLERSWIYSDFVCIVLALSIYISLVQVRSYVYSTPTCTSQHQVLIGLGTGFGAIPNGLGTVLDLLEFCCIVLALYINSSLVQVRSYVFSTPTCTGQHQVLIGLGHCFGAVPNGLGIVMDLL